MVLFHESEGTVHLLNETAGLIYESCDGKKTLGEVAELLEVEFEVDTTRALADTVEVATDLLGKSLLFGDA